MQLVYPTVQHKSTYLQAIEEAKDEKQTTQLAKPNEGESFESFVQRKKEEAEGKNLPEGWVPATELWLIDNDEFIGRINIRHQLTDYLFTIGGHIGYWIRPSKRKMGYGKKILELALPEAKKLDITKVLVTCDDTNLGSAKIIEANGGILENIVETEEGHPKTRRYWIQLH